MDRILLAAWLLLSFNSLVTISFYMVPKSQSLLKSSEKFIAKAQWTVEITEVNRLRKWGINYY